MSKCHLLLEVYVVANNAHERFCNIFEDCASMFLFPVFPFEPNSEATLTNGIKDCKTKMDERGENPKGDSPRSLKRILCLGHIETDYNFPKSRYENRNSCKYPFPIDFEQMLQKTIQICVLMHYKTKFEVFIKRKEGYCDVKSDR